MHKNLYSLLKLECAISVLKTPHSLLLQVIVLPGAMEVLLLVLSSMTNKTKLMVILVKDLEEES